MPHQRQPSSRCQKSAPENCTQPLWAAWFSAASHPKWNFLSQKLIWTERLYLLRGIVHGLGKYCTAESLWTFAYSLNCRSRSLPTIGLLSLALAFAKTSHEYSAAWIAQICPLARAWIKLIRVSKVWASRLISLLPGLRFCWSRKNSSSCLEACAID